VAKILIVDDVETDRLLLGGVVRKAGHDPLYASDGDVAVQQAKAVKPALVFMDVVMPKLNGFNACRMIKQDAETKQIPVVLVTSKGMDSDKFWGKKQGADEHMPKPFTPEQVMEVIRRFVG
jgi:twitching motility two-component system response regulator PilH